MIDSVISRYHGYLALERSLSANTTEAYRRDLDKLLEWTEAAGRNYRDLTLADLERELALRHR